MFAADIKKFLFDSFKRKGTKKKNSLPRRLSIEYKFYQTTTYWLCEELEHIRKEFDDEGGYEVLKEIWCLHI